MEDVSSLDRFSEGLAAVGHTLTGIFWKGEKQLLITLGHCQSSHEQSTSDKLQGLVLNLPFLLSPLYKMLGCSLPLACGLGALPLGVYFMLGGSALLGISNTLHSRSWTVWKGEKQPINPNQVKVMHLNVCMFPGSLPYHFGKQVPATERLEALASKIREENPDLFFLSEMGQTFSSSLYEKIKGDYHLFVVNVGSMSWRTDSDLYFVSKIKIENVEFIESKVPRIGDQKWMNRGYLMIETDKVKYIYTHLHPKESEEAKEVRRLQIEKELLPLMKKGDKPFLLIGDLNIDRKSSEYPLITKHFDDRLEKITTCQEGDVQESVDYFLTLKGEKRLKLTKPEVNLDLRLSDHATLITTVELAKKVK